MSSGFRGVGLRVWGIGVWVFGMRCHPGIKRADLVKIGDGVWLCLTWAGRPCSSRLAEFAAQIRQLLGGQESVPK